MEVVPAPERYKGSVLQYSGDMPHHPYCEQQDPLEHRPLPLSPLPQLLVELVTAAQDEPKSTNVGGGVLIGGDAVGARVPTEPGASVVVSGSPSTPPVFPLQHTGPNSALTALHSFWPLTIPPARAAS